MFFIFINLNKQTEIIMELIHNAVSWFEIPVADFDRAKNFYSTIYDYQMPEMDMGAVKMGILLHHRDNGGIGGAIVCGEMYVPSKQGARIYLNAGNDVNTVLDRVVPAGGKVILGKSFMGDSMGYIAVIEDTEGNYISLHSAN